MVSTSVSVWTGIGRVTIDEDEGETGLDEDGEAIDEATDDERADDEAAENKAADDDDGAAADDGAADEEKGLNTAGEDG